MKKAEEWRSRLATDAEFAQKYKGLKNVEDIVKLARSQNYEISLDDLEDGVSGGLNIVVSSDVTGKVTGNNNCMKISSKVTQKILY